MCCNEEKTVELLIRDVLEFADSLVKIDENDVKDLFQEDGKLYAFDISVDAANENRISLMLDELKRKSMSVESYEKALVFFFFPQNKPLLMEELKPFSDWIESVPGDFMIKWGMAIHSKREVRTIVVLQ